LEAVWPQVQQWLNEQPDAHAKELFLPLQESMPGTFPSGQLQTLQRRVQQWRSEIARQLVLGLVSETEMDREMCSASTTIYSEVHPGSTGWISNRSSAA
jgi:hypothetical protein